MRTMAEMLRWRAQRHPSLEAIWFEGRAQTFAQFNESTSQLAAGFVEKLGLSPGDRVGILDKNSAAYFELLFALDKAGLVAAPLNWRLTPREIKQIVDDAKPKLIVVGAEFKAAVEGTGVPVMTFGDLPRGGEDPRRDRDGAVCAHFCTSGTTGVPKGAMLTGWNLLNIGSCGAIEAPEMRENGRSLICLPLFHIGGTMWAMWAMQTGSTVVIVREPLPDTDLDSGQPGPHLGGQLGGQVRWLVIDGAVHHGELAADFVRSGRLITRFQRRIRRGSGAGLRDGLCPPRLRSSRGA